MDWTVTGPVLQSKSMGWLLQRSDTTYFGGSPIEQIIMFLLGMASYTWCM